MPAFINLADSIALLDEQLVVLEAILEYQYKADALLDSAVNGYFLQNPKSVVHNLLCVLSDILKEAKRLNEDLLKSTAQIILVFKNAASSSGTGSVH